MQRWTRIAAVTAGLVVAGGIFGTIAGTTLLVAWQVALEGFTSSSDGFESLLIFGIVFGGGLGAVLGPLAAWTLMRHVPLWLAVGGTTLGTFASGGAALLLTGNPFFAMLVGMIGFMMSAAALNLRSTGDEQRRLGS
jgi:hypothetical protein